MAFYFVRARIQPEMAQVLRERLESRAFEPLHPFGHTLHSSLVQAKRDPISGEVLWEEECYCQVPLAQERAAVLDRYFASLQIERVERGKGWERVQALPVAFP